MKINVGLNLPAKLTNKFCFSLFEVPARLPLHHFSVLNQCCALLSATSLLFELSLDSEADLYLFNLLLSWSQIYPIKCINKLLRKI